MSGMRISGGSTENGIVVGNAYDKYGSANPIVRRIMAGFEGALSDLVARAAPSDIHEVGCGEGYWVMRWLDQGLAARGSDFSTHAISLARENAARRGLEARFEPRSIYDLRPGQDDADLIVCCEVLEHLEDPQAGLAALASLRSRHVILSVPREPLWRAMNMARGKYLGSLGNTPGHLQHWSKAGFVQMVSRYFEPIAVRSPVPWTMVLCRRRPAPAP